MCTLQYGMLMRWPTISDQMPSLQKLIDKTTDEFIYKFVKLYHLQVLPQYSAKHFPRVIPCR